MAEPQSAKNWNPATWRTKPVRQMPDYPDSAAISAVETRLKSYPPLVFAGGAKGLALDLETLTLKVIDVVDGDVSGVIVHNVKNRAVAHMLVEMPFGPFPMALGVLYDDPAPTFESAVVAQIAKASEGKTPDLQKLVAKGQTWMVDKQPRAE